MNAPMNAAPVAARKLRVATTSLAGCFGCHMSFLDIDERAVQIAAFALVMLAPLGVSLHLDDDALRAYDIAILATAFSGAAGYLGQELARQPAHLLDRGPMVAGGPLADHLRHRARGRQRHVLHQPRDGALILPAAMETHTDAEMDMLEKCVGRRAPWAG